MSSHSTPLQHRTWYSANRDRVLERARLRRIARYAADPEKAAAEDYAAQKRYRERNKEAINTRQTLRRRDSGSEAATARWAKTRPFRAAGRMIHHVRRRALRDNIPFTITIGDIHPLPSVCPVCGKTMGAGAKCPASDRRSLDKIQPQLGYVPGNVAVICVSCNSVKGQSTPEQLVALVKWLHKVYPAWLLITENP